jgi:exoribonuclease R
MTKKKTSLEKKLFQHLLQATYEFIRGKHYIPLSKASLIDRLKINENHLEIFDHVLKELHRDAKVEYHNDKYLPAAIIASSEKTKQGIICVHPRGFGFVAVGEKEDVFIPKHEIHGATDADTVEIAIDTLRVSDKGPEGRVIRILARKRRSISGIIIELMQNEAIAYCPVLSGEAFATVELSQSERANVQIGDRYVFTVNEWGTGKERPTVCLELFIGHIKDASKDTLEAMHEFNLP